jgi:hypothetical protein
MGLNMKSIQNITVDNITLTCLGVSEDNENAKMTYFIDGIEITKWETLSNFYKDLFTAMADSLCKGMVWHKWENNENL